MAHDIRNAKMIELDLLGHGRTRRVQEATSKDTGIGSTT